MPQPPIGPGDPRCGGTNQPPCPPQPAAVKGTQIYASHAIGYPQDLWTRDQIDAHGAVCYAKGAADHAAGRRRAPNRAVRRMYD